MTMKLPAVVLGSLLSISAVRGADPVPASPPATQPANAQQRIAAGVAASINLIKAATEPSSAIDAYAIGMSIDPDSRELRSAYVAKMAELGAPDLAFSQAQQVLNNDASNPVAKSVLAMGQARRGNLSEAMSQIVAAAKQSPDDPIVQRTMAQLLALYDRQISKPVLSDATRNDIENLRRSMALKQSFADAYKQAIDYYAKSPSTSSSPSMTEVAPPVTSYPTQTNTYRNDTYYDTPAYIPSAITRYTYVNDYLPAPTYYLYNPYWSYNRGAAYCPPGYDNGDFNHNSDRWRNRSDHRSNPTPNLTPAPLPTRTIPNVERRFAPRTPEQIRQERNVPITPAPPSVSRPDRRPVGPIANPPRSSSGSDSSENKRSTK